jgi:hypothetical protein
MTRHACTRWAGSLAAFAGTIVLLLAGSARFQASPQTLPTGAELIARHVAAIGGEAAYKAVTSVRARGRLEIPAQGLGGDLELLSARPDKLLYRVTVPGIGRIENGFNGKVGWSINPVSGPELLTGRQLTEAAEDAWFDGTLHGRDHVRDLTTLARTEFDDRPAFKAKVTLTSGSDQIEYFDADTGLEIGSEAVRATPMGLVPTVNILRNYRRFGALLQATTFVQRALGFEQVVTINSCEYDVVPENAFDPPAEVAALLKPPAAAALLKSPAAAR